MRRILTSSLLGSLCLVLHAGLANAEPRRPTHIACVGDSITFGSHASAPSKNYPSVLQTLVGKSAVVKNFGHSGATMLSTGYGDLPYDKQAEYTAATDFVSKAGANAVVSVVIILGANDSKPINWEPSGKPKNDQQYLKDYRAMVDHFAGLPTKPTVYIGYPLSTGTNPCCTIRGAVIHDQELPLIKQVATEKHVPIIDLNTPTAGHPEYFADGVHPNDNGYAIMAGLVLVGLQREPTVKITSPVAGASVSAGGLSLVADAAAGTVEIAGVEFFEGNQSLGKVAAKPFALPWVASLGTHTVTAKATDKTLANATSASTSFTVAGTGEEAGAAGAAGAENSEGGSPPSSSGGRGTVGGSAGAPLVGGAPSTAGSSGSSGSSGAAEAEPAADTDAGCTCSLPSRRSNRPAFALVAGALGLMILRRARRVNPS